jgi:hypothetical protein
VEKKIDTYHRFFPDIELAGFWLLPRPAIIAVTQG